MFFLHEIIFELNRITWLPYFGFCRDLLEQIKDFEEMEFSGAKRDDFKLQRLEPVNEGGGSALLNMV